MGKLNFKDWLTEQVKNRPNEDEATKKKEEWLSALESLYQQMRNWLRQDDPQEIIQIRKMTERLKEQDLGVYDAPSLRFHLYRDTVAAVPVARNVIGPGKEYGPNASIKGVGRVDLIANGEKVHLFRVRDLQGNTWWVVADQELNLTTLDKELFQEILQRLFS